MSYHYATKKYVPIVIKDYSTLLGYCEALGFMKNSYRYGFNSNNRNNIKLIVPMYHAAMIALSSFRFNSICFLDIDIDSNSLSDIKDKLTDYYTNLIEFKKQIPDEEKPLPLWVDDFLTFDCPHCGMNHSFKYSEEVPETDYYCEVCGEIMIDYTNKHDHDFVYLGDDRRRLAFKKLEENVIHEISKNF
jgi:hypothetical protein